MFSQFYISIFLYLSIHQSFNAPCSGPVPGSAFEEQNDTTQRDAVRACVFFCYPLDVRLHPCPSDAWHMEGEK